MEINAKISEKIWHMQRITMKVNFSEFSVGEIYWLDEAISSRDLSIPSLSQDDGSSKIGRKDKGRRRETEGHIVKREDDAEKEWVGELLPSISPLSHALAAPSSQCTCHCLLTLLTVWSQTYELLLLLPSTLNFLCSVFLTPRQTDVQRRKLSKVLA